MKDIDRTLQDDLLCLNLTYGDDNSTGSVVDVCDYS
jgi:hypothetical protein